MADNLGRLENGVPRQRRYAPRSRIGCVTCKRRRKRCAGGRPACDACRRLNLECTWDPKQRLSDQASSHSQENRTATTDSSGFQRRLQRRLSSPTPVPQSTSQLISPLAPPPGAPTLQELDQRIILSYYIHSFVPNISVVNVPSNFFTSVYVPMGFQCSAVLDAITACASSHLAKTSSDETRRSQLLRLASTHQAQCYSFLSERISLSGHLQRDILESVAVILLLIGIEVQNGSRTRKWMSQLDCIRNIIKHQGGKASFCRSSWEAECIYQHFLYHDVMSLIMSGISQKPIEMETQTIEPSDSSPSVFGPTEMPWEQYVAGNREEPSNGTATIVHPLLGLSKDLFFLIQKIRHVRFMGSPVSPFDFVENQFFFDLEREITTLRFDLTQTSYDRIDIGTRLDLLTLSETCRLAALILLYRRSVTHSDQLAALAQNIISLAERIPEGNPAEAGLTYPLFLAGAELDSEEDISRCAKKLISIRRRMNMMNIQAVEEVLEEVWRERLNGGIYKDWESVLQDWQWVINLA